MSSPAKSGSWYWVFLVPLVFIGFFWAIDELNINESVVIPGLTMTCTALLVILVTHYRHAKRRGRSLQINWFPWLIVAPGLFLGLALLIEELNINDSVYIPAFLFTMVSAIIVFTKKPQRLESTDPTMDERVEQLLAAKMAEAGLVSPKKGPSWIWAVLIPVAGVTIISVFGILSGILSEMRQDRTRVAVTAEAFAPNNFHTWPHAIAEAERQDKEARREAERILRMAQRRAVDVERRIERKYTDAISVEQAKILLAEKQKTKHQVEEAKVQLEQAKSAAQASLEIARRQLQQKIEDSDIDVTIEGLTIDGDGFKLHLNNEGQAMVLRLDSEGVTVASIDGDSDENAECEDAEGILAECDEAYWNEQRGEWEDVASEIYRVLIADEEDEHDAIDDTQDQVVATFSATAPENLRAEWAESVGKPQPLWVLEGSELSGNTHRLVVMTGPLETHELCLAKRGPQIEKSVAKYAATHLDGGIRLPSKRLREYVVDEYYGIHQSSTPGVGDLPVIYTQLEFDEDFREELVATHRQQSIATTKMARAGIGSFGILGLLATVFGYLKLDERTQGNKRGRLQLGATGLIAMLAVLCGLFLTLVPLL